MKPLRQKPLTRAERARGDSLDGALAQYLRHGIPAPEGAEEIPQDSHHGYYNRIVIVREEGR